MFVNIKSTPILIYLEVEFVLDAFQRLANLALQDGFVAASGLPRALGLLPNLRHELLDGLPPGGRRRTSPGLGAGNQRPVCGGRGREPQGRSSTGLRAVCRARHGHCKMDH
eukprot:4817434-Pyramimonas_sp.AAC.1